MPHSQSSPPPIPTPILQAAVDDLVSILHQPAPPSLRELLEAYSLKGNGDRDLLLAMLSAKSSEDQRVAAVIQSHQTLIQAHAVAQSNMHQLQLQTLPQQQQQQQQQHHHQHHHQQHHLLTQQPHHHQPHAQNHPTVPPHPTLLSPSTPVIAPPSPSGTSQSQSSTSSPKLQTTLPPLHSHLADLRSLPSGPHAKRRRTDREAMLLDPPREMGGHGVRHHRHPNSHLRSSNDNIGTGTTSSRTYPSGSGSGRVSSPNQSRMTTSGEES